MLLAMRPRTPVWLLLALGLAEGLSACGGPEPNTRSKDAYDRYLGVREIGDTRDLASESELLRLIADPSYLVVTGVLEAMARIGRKEYLPYVLPKLQLKEKDPADVTKERENPPMVRAQACETVAVLAAPERLEPLIAVLQNDPDLGVRRAAVKTIADRYGKLPRALKVLIETVGDKDPSISLNAHNKLQELTGRMDVPRSKEAWSKAVQP